MRIDPRASILTGERPFFSNVPGLVEGAERDLHWALSCEGRHCLASSSPHSSEIATCQGSDETSALAGGLVLGDVLKAGKSETWISHVTSFLQCSYALLNSEPRSSRFTSHP